MEMNNNKKVMQSTLSHFSLFEYHNNFLYLSSLFETLIKHVVFLSFYQHT